MKWGGAVVSVLSLGLWLASGWHLWYDFDTWAILLEHGRLTTNEFGGRLTPSWPRGFHCGSLYNYSLAPEWGFTHQDKYFGNSLALPLWPFPIVAIAPTVIAWRRDRVANRVLRGLCPKCSYDRAGLVSGAVCPECGAAAPVAISPPAKGI